MGSFITYLEKTTEKDRIIYPSQMDTLNSKDRAVLPDSEFALPKERKFPINDIAHAKLALEYVNKISSLIVVKQQVEDAVYKKFPELIPAQNETSVSTREQ